MKHISTAGGTCINTHSPLWGCLEGDKDPEINTQGSLVGGSVSYGLKQKAADREPLLTAFPLEGASIYPSGSLGAP